MSPDARFRGSRLGFGRVGLFTPPLSTSLTHWMRPRAEFIRVSSPFVGARANGPCDSQTRE
jgi:hypothetical protein